MTVKKRDARVDLPPKMIDPHVHEMSSTPYEMPPISPKQDAKGNGMMKRVVTQVHQNHKHNHQRLQYLKNH